MGEVIEQPVSRFGTGRRIAQRQPIVFVQPSQMGRDNHKADGGGEIRPRGGEATTGPRIDQHEKQKRQSENDHEILGPEREAERHAQHRPMAEVPGSQRAMERQSGQRPERQLDYVMIEFRRGEIEEMQSIDDQNGGRRGGRSCDPKHHRPYGRKRRQNAELPEGIIGHVGIEGAIGDLDEPPWQRRQFVVAELPFASVGQGLDDVERQV